MGKSLVSCFLRHSVACYSITVMPLAGAVTAVGFHIIHMQFVVLFHFVISVLLADCTTTFPDKLVAKRCSSEVLST